MATTEDLNLADSLIRGLDLFWLMANDQDRRGDSFAQWEKRLRGAQEAMDWLVSAAQYDRDIRLKIAQANLFSQALTREKNRIVDHAVVGEYNQGPVLNWGLDLNPSFKYKPPRLILLQGLRRWAGGTFMSPPEKDGIAPWILDSELAETAIRATLTHDPYPAVVLELLSILATCAYPAEWAMPRAADLFGAPMNPSALCSTLQAFDAALPFTVCPFPSPGRETIGQRSGDFCTDMPTSMFQAFSATARRALGRCQELAATPEVQALLKSAGIPTTWANPQTGNGQHAPTPPPPRRPWYKNGRLISAGVLGAIAGAIASTRK